jgi:hypothetical protein
MHRFLVETYLSRGELRRPAAWERRARSAAEEMTLLGRDVRFVHGLLVPEDETAFFIFDAPSRREAALVAELGGLEAVRVVEVSSESSAAQPRSEHMTS